jgi:hypothetical protein
MTKNKISIFLIIAALTSGAVNAKREFRLNQDGFSFPNYGNEQKPLNLTPATLEYLCGPGTCARGTGQTCVLSGAMRQLMDKFNKDMGAGHCDGMAAVAEGIYTNRMPLSRFDRNARTTFNLKKTPALQSDIAYYWTTQLTEPTQSNKRRNLTPNQMLSILRNPGNESYSIHMFNPGFRNGHAVTPIKVIDQGPNQSQVEIYDSNFPNSKRFITVYKKSNTWTYQGYKLGNTEKKIINLVPLTARLQRQSCYVSGNDDARPFRPGPQRPSPQRPFQQQRGPEQRSPRRPVQPQRPQFEDEQEYWEQDDGGWDVQLDNNGFQLKDGIKLLSDVIQLFAGSADAVIPVTDSTASSIYRFAPDKDRNFKLAADNLRAKATTDLYVGGHGHMMALEGLRPHKGQVDDLSIGKDGETLGYATKFDEPVTVRLNETYSGADYEVRIRPVARKGGYKVRVHNIVDAKEGHHELELQLKNNDGSPAHYTIEILRIGDTADDKFLHTSKDLTIGPNELDRLEYGAWIRDKQPLAVRDVIDGRIVKELLVKDED